MFRFVSLMAAAAFGSLLAFFFDPNSGRGRRAKAQDRLGAFLRRSTNRIEKRGHYAASRIGGLGHQLENALAGQNEEAPNDATLVQRVESQIMRGQEATKGAININAEDGVIVLRGRTGSVTTDHRLGKSCPSREGGAGSQESTSPPWYPGAEQTGAAIVGGRRRRR